MGIVKLTFSFDDEMDAEILEFLAKVPKKRRSDVVRRAMEAWVNGKSVQQMPIHTPAESEVVNKRKPSLDSLGFGPDN